MMIDEELRSTAFHEGGHAVVAEHLTGIAASIELVRTGKRGITWIAGRCLHAPGRTPGDCRSISLAGACAEILSGDSRDNLGDALLNPITARISASDAANAGGSYSRRDVWDCVALCRQLWPWITARAHIEINRFHQREVAGSASRAYS